MGATSRRSLLLAAVLGLGFGFFLQKGGVAKYHVLVGVLLLEDLTVIKVMLTAIVVGAVGVHLLQRAGRAEPQIEPTRWLANVAGGLIFGIGFGLNGYCPGTQAAAIGQGNFDALAGVVGMLAGSWLFAELSGPLQRVGEVGDRGPLTLAGVARTRAGRFLMVFLPALVAVLAVLETLTPR
jgi:uncharacterized membrane protein YedE/YeeE